MALSFPYCDKEGVTTGKIPNNGSNMPIVYLAQDRTGGGSKWATLPFGDGTIASSGCSLASYAMVATYLLA